MPHHLKHCPVCQTYTISAEKCEKCKSILESVYPARFSLQDKYQNYRLQHFKEKMQKKYQIP